MDKILYVGCRFALSLTVILLITEYIYSQSNEKTTKFLPKLLKQEVWFDTVVKNPQVYEVQIIYTQINRKKNKVKFVDHYYGVDKDRYFYPSRTVFLPVAALTLEKINRLSKEYDVDKHRYVRIDNALTQEIMIYQDPSSENNYASFAHFIEKMFKSGDRTAFNFCYDFLDQRYLNERMHGLGYGDSWMLHKLDGKAPETSRQSNAVTFFRTDIKSYYIDIIHLKRHPTTISFYSVFVKKGEYNPVDYYSDRTKILLGKATADSAGNMVDSSVDFSYRNQYSIEDMHGFLKSLIFPDVHRKKLDLSGDDYAFLYRQMSENSAESNYILNDKLNDRSIRIFNSSGKDFGFMVDNAYVIDTKNGIDFFLTVVIKCNRSNIFRDEYYDYEKTGLLFMKNLSNFIHRYEINRKENGAVEFDDFLNKIPL